MLGEREMLEAVLNSTPEQCRAAGDLFLALADRPRDIHFRADIQRRLDALPVPPASDWFTQYQAVNKRMAERDAELWKIGWHPSQLLKELKRIGFAGEGGCPMPPDIEDLIVLDDEMRDAGMWALKHPGEDTLRERERNERNVA